MEILKPDQIKQPLEAVIEQEVKTEDWLLGATGGTPINPSMDWTPYVTEYELQRNKHFDNYSCVTNTAWNLYQTLINFKYGIKIDKSKRYTAVISGTKPRQGNSMQAPFESIRKDDCVDDEDYPSMTPDMTEVEYFKKIPDFIKTQVNFLKDYSTTHEFLPSGSSPASNEEIMTGLTISPVGVCVNGNYQFDKDGNLCNDDGNVTHALLIVKAEPGKRYLAVDSENPNGLLPIKWGYKFRYCKIGYVEKKNQEVLGYPFIKFGKGIYQLSKEGKYKGKYVGWSNWDLFLACNGDYSKLPITTVKSLPSNTSDALVTYTLATPLNTKRTIIDLFSKFFKK